MSRDRDESMREHALRIMEALSGVDEELLERSGRERQRRNLTAPGHRRASRTGAVGSRKRPIWQAAGAWAAALCLGVAGIASWSAYGQRGGAGDGSPLVKSGTVYEENGMDMAGGQNDYPGDAPECEGAADVEEHQKLGPAQGDAAAQGNGTAQGDGMVQGNGAAQGDAAAQGNGAAQENSSVKDNSAVHTGVESAGNYGDTGRKDGLPQNIDSENTGGFGQNDTEDGMTEIVDGCGKLNAIEYSLQAAGQIEGLGEYVPETLPEGYKFESAYSNQDLDRENLTVSWSRGMDMILLHLEQTQGTVETVDVEKPEIYDERLYEVPYGETVPEEYRQVFQDPVFALEDFSLEIVESRMKAYEDSGDAATPRGNFKVLYPDGVLVSFNGRGTAQEIWDMFCSMGH